MDTSTNLGLPYIVAAQAQKHVTHNEAIRALDALVQLSVADRNLTAPPSAPADGARYIVAPSATGAWAGKDNAIAAFQDGAWAFYPPLEGWIAWVGDEDVLAAWNGTAWVTTTGGSGGGVASVNPVPLVGVNATADTTNRLAVASPASLFNHDGAGHQVKVNKSATTATASLLFQTGYSGRAEMGTTGDDDFHVKVSADGASWREAIVVNRSTGTVSLPNTPAQASAASGPIYNRSLPRAWAKIGELAIGTANERLTLFCIGDSISPALMNTMLPRLKLEHGNGGTAGYLSGFNQFLDDGNGTAVQMSVAVSGGSGATLDSDAFAKSPIGSYWLFTPGATKYWGVGATDGQTPLAPQNPKVFTAPPITSRFGVFYLQQPGGGTLKVQVARGYTTTLFDVPGLTAINTDGTLGLKYVETAFAAWSAGSTYAVGNWVIFNDKAYRCQTATTAGQSPDTTPAAWMDMTSTFRIALTQTAGGNVIVLGALVGASRGVIGHCWGIGGLAMSNVVASPRFAELAALVKPDIVAARYIDRPGDATLVDNSAWTPDQMATHAMGGLRGAFPATIVPADPAPWGLANLTAEKPHFLWFGPHNVNYLYDGAAQAAAMKANALAAGDCYVDTIAMIGAWQKAWDMGLMGSGDGGPGSSVHQRYIFDAALISAVLRETGLIGGALVRSPPNPRFETLAVGPNTPGTSAELGQFNKAARAKIGDAHTNVSFGPADDAQYTNVALKIYGDDGVYSAGLLFDSSGNAGGNRYLAVAQPGAGFSLLQVGQQAFLQWAASGSQLFLGWMSAYPTLYLGRRGTGLTGLRHGNATLAAGVATVTDSQITANANIVVSRRARGGTPGTTYEVTPASGSFTITARTGADAVATADTSTVSYIVVEP